MTLTHHQDTIHAGKVAFKETVHRAVDASVSPLFAIIYGRVSTDKQEREGASLPEQLRLCEEKAKELGIVNWIELTESETGAIDRPGLQRVRELVAQGGITHFICFDPDRLTRGLTLQLLVTEELEKAGLTMVFVDHEYRNTPEGKLFYALRGAVSEYERYKILERTQRGRYGKLREGRVVSGRPPYGYKPDPERPGFPLIDEEQAAIVRSIFDWVIAGDSLRSIARRLTAMGAPTRNAGRRWTATGVRNIAQNLTYTGRMIANRYIQRKGEPRGIRPAEEWVELQVPPIVSDETYLRALSMLDNRRRVFNGRGNYLLTGLCYCGRCGTAMCYCSTTQTYKGRRRNYVYLRCNNRQSCNVAARSQEVDNAVWGYITDCLLDPAYHEQMVRDATEGGAASRAAELEQQLCKWQAALKEAQDLQILTLREAAHLDPEVRQKILSEQTERIATIRAEAKRTENELALLKQTEKKIASAVQAASRIKEAIQASRQEVAEALENMELEERRRIARLLILKVVVHDKDRLEIVPRVD